jgi:hypothetical protein
MMQPAHVVVHTTPEGHTLPVLDDQGHVLLFEEIANAESFARGLVEAGLPDAILADFHDLDLLGVPAHGSGTAAVFEDRIAGLSAEQGRDEARQLALQLAPALRLR